MHRLHILILAMCFLSIPITAVSQIQNIHIGINGLTCSQCTRNVEMSLRKLTFVQDVKMDLQHTDGIITLKPDSKFNPRGLVNAVKNAGFSVRFLTAVIDPIPFQTKETNCFILMDCFFSLIPRQDKFLNNHTVVQFIGEGFMPSKELKKWLPEMRPLCKAYRELYFITKVSDEHL